MAAAKRARCPGCGSVASLHTRAELTQGWAVVSSRCTYMVGRRMCGHPIAAVLTPTGVRYAFPPTFEPVNTLDADALLREHGRG